MESSPRRDPPSTMVRGTRDGNFGKKNSPYRSRFHVPFRAEYLGGPSPGSNGSTPRRTEYAFAHYHNESVVGTVLACAVVFGAFHLSSKEVCGGAVAGGIYVIVLVVVAHFDPIGMGIEMVASCNGVGEVQAQWKCITDRTVKDGIWRFMKI